MVSQLVILYFLLIYTTYGIADAQTSIPCQSRQQVDVNMYMGKKKKKMKTKEKKKKKNAPVTSKSGNLLGLTKAKVSQNNVYTYNTWR